MNAISRTFGRQLSEDEEIALRAYIESHPRFDDNAEKLDEELEKLPDTVDVDTDLETAGPNGDTAATVNVDVEKLLDDENTYFSEEVREALEEREPTWVNTENEELEEVVKERGLPTTTEGFREAVAEIPNATDSIIEMRDEHERDVDSVYISDGDALQFSFERYQTDWVVTGVYSLLMVDIPSRTVLT